VDERLGRALHVVFVGSLAALFAIQALKRLGLDSTAALIGLSALTGGLTAVALWRVRLVRTFFTVLSPAPLVFLVVFLFASPVTKLVFPQDVEVAVANVSAGAPVVVVVLDELPVTSLLRADGSIDAARFPTFARFARDATWFRNATTLSASTTLAVPALLTGKEPRRGKLPLFQNHPNNLFTLLGARYRLNVTESQTRLCPSKLCRRQAPDTTERLSSLYSDARVVYLHLVAPPNLEDRLPAIDESWGDFGKDDVRDAGDLGTALGDEKLPKIDIRTFYVGRVREFKRFVTSLRRDPRDRPSLDFLHVLLPHGPWLYFPDGRVSAAATPRAPGRKGELWLDEGLARQAHQRHLLQLGFTDRLLGQLVGKLERAGLYDRALVVVTADHGISFHGGDKRRAPTDTNLVDLAFVPLFVKLPGQKEGKVVDRHVRIVDVLPTIADGLGVELPWKVDGRSALAGGTGSATVRVGQVEASFSAELAKRDEALSAQVRLFGAGAWEGVFRAGKYGALVGRRVASLEVAGEGDGEATVDELGSRLLRSLPRRSALVPSPLVGILSGGVAKGTDLAVAVNERIAAVARAYELGDGVVRFSALAPESAFRPGRNDVRMFVLGGPPTRPELRELAVSLSG
jgi:Sulfatase